MHIYSRSHVHHEVTEEVQVWRADTQNFMSNSPRPRKETEVARKDNNVSQNQTIVHQAMRQSEKTKLQQRVHIKNKGMMIEFINKKTLVTIANKSSTL